MEKTLKALVVGSGDMGEKHARAYQRLPNVDLCAVADPDGLRAGRMAAELNVQGVYAGFQEAIEQERPDIVSVCVPAFLHAGISAAALEQGCHVLCEKPLALTLEDARRMLDAAEKSNAHLAVVFQRRFMPVWQEVEQRLPALGAPLSYQAADFRPVRPKVLMHSKSGNGGPVIDCCVHDFNMVLHLFGKPASVYAMGDVYADGKSEVDSVRDLAVDTAAISIRFEAGHKALVSYCWGLPTGYEDSVRAEILGPNGLLRIFPDSLEHHLPGGRVETVRGLEEEGHPAQIAAFVDAIAGGQTPPVNPGEALPALEVACAALASIESGAAEPLG